MYGLHSDCGELIEHKNDSVKAKGVHSCLLSAYYVSRFVLGAVDTKIVLTVRFWFFLAFLLDKNHKHILMTAIKAAK